MTSPRTPRQWNAGDPEPPVDVKELRDAKGNRMLRLERGRWRFAPFTLNTKPWAAKRDYPKWTKLDDHFWMEWPLSEVLPETPEPPRETCDASTAWSDGVTTSCQLSPGHEGEHRDDRADVVNPLKAKLAQAREDLEEARGWAKHGYEIGQRSCTWSDQGVAPRWLIESYRSVPASQSVPAVPVSSTGGKETGEAAEGAEKHAQPIRCGSCEHDVKYHQPDGCWYAVTKGRLDRNTVCACAATPEDVSGPLTMKPVERPGCVVSECPCLQPCPVHQSSPLPDSETESDAMQWGYREHPYANVDPVREEYARFRAQDEHLRLVQREVRFGPWIEVTS